MSTGFLCKKCGAESPVGIGYAGSPDRAEPDPECPGPHEPQNWLGAAREVVEHGFRTINPVTGQVMETKWKGDEVTDNGNGVILDAFTASMLTQIYDALSEANKATFLAMPLTKAVDFGWKLTARVKEKKS